MENIDFGKEMKGFQNKFLLSTEFISYFILVPSLLLYIWVNLSLSDEQFSLLLKCTAFAVCISMPTTHINNLIVISPIKKYFKKILDGEKPGEDEYIEAQKRFLSLPFIHAFGSAYRWVIGLSLALAPFTYMSELNSVQKYNLWAMVVFMPPLGAVLHFLLTEIFIQKMLKIFL